MTDDPTLDRLLDEWEVAHDAGRDVPPADLCRDHPDLRPEVERRIAALKRFARPPTADPLPTPTPVPVFPGFEIERVLGEGGMGVVYLARETGLKRPVALKLLRGHGPVSPDRVARLRREAELVARLRHPNVVQIHAVVEHAGQVALVLEYLPGGSLAAALAGQPLTPLEAAALVETVARAVHAAHLAGIVHRDLKPGNILLGNDERGGMNDEWKSGPGPHSSLITHHSSLRSPKVADFGLAKVFEAGPALTQSGAIVGTPCYMAPEQATGRSPVGPPADVYALGTILYECLTGRPPFTADSTFGVLAQVADADPVPPRDLRAGIPRDLETVCLKCLEKEPGRRYSSAAALADDLGRFRRHEPVRARPVGPMGRLARFSRRNPRLALAIGTAVLALVAGTTASTVAAVRATRAAAARDVALGQSEDDRQRAVVRLAEGELDTALRLADARQAGACTLWLARSLDTLATAPRPEPALERVIRTNAAGWDAEVVRLGAVLEHPGPVAALAWSPDGRTLWTAAYTGPNDGETTELRAWETGGPGVVRASVPRIVSALAVSPDGATVVAGGTGKRVHFVRATDGAEVRPPLEVGDRVRGLAFRSDGAVIAAAAGTSVHQLDGRTFEPRGFPLAYPEDVVSVVFEPDGRRLATGHSDGVRVRDPDHPAEAVWPTRGIAWGLAWGTGGVVAGDSSGRVTAWHPGPAGRPTGESALGTYPTFVGTVAHLPAGPGVLVGTKQGDLELWTTVPPACVARLPRHRDRVTRVAARPDGKAFASASADGTVAVWEMPTLEPSTELPAAGLVWRTAVSGDGSVVAVGTVAGTVHTWETTTLAPAGPPLAHVVAVRGARFGASGARLVTTADDDKAHVWDVATGKRWLTFPAAPAAGLVADLCPDGRLAAAGDRGGTVHVWDVEARAPAVAPVRLDGRVAEVRFHPTEPVLLVGLHTGAIHELDLRTGEIVGAVRTHGGYPDWIGTAAGDRRFVSGTTSAIGPIPDQRWVRLWEAGAAPALTLRLPRPATCLAWDGPSDRLAVGDESTEAVVWDLTAGRPTGRPMVHPGHALHIAFAPAGDRLVTTSHSPLYHRPGLSPSGEVRVWDAASGRPLSPPIPSGRSRAAPVLTRDHLFVPADDRLDVIPLTRPTAASAAELRRRAEARSGLTLDATGAVRILEPGEWRARSGGSP